MSNPQQRQHGDVTLEKVAVVPSTAKQLPSKNNTFILAEGEVTGHSHVVTAEPGTGQLWTDGEQLYMVLEKAAPLTHEEHPAQILESGIWKVGRVNEIDPLDGMVRKVQD